MTVPTASTGTLAGVPSLPPLLLRGALLSPLKRPRPDAGFPRTRLVLPGLRVDLARLAAYERVCGFPTGADALPVTYPHVLGFPVAMRLMSGRAFPLPLLGLVHTSIGITRRAALPATGEYELCVYVEGLSPHRRGTEARVVTELRAGGRAEPVWESRSTYLARHRGDGSAAPRDGEPAAAGTQDRDPAAANAQHRDPAAANAQHRDPAAANTQDHDPDAANAGPLPVRAEWRLAGDVGRRYGAASGDRNPIHLHPFTARLFGFPRAIAHGMWTVARCLAEHGTPDAAVVRADFRAPVLLPGTVVYGAGDGRFELRGGDGRRQHLCGEVVPYPA
ncbi:MaoC/PaaZ C-terminal domain-containing protein [Streptomyces mutabilis]|uniref:Dehydratase n=1 Tax=Streptomyces mutabilis TaxID=67332 RepID=A0A086MZT7_9ACTN|nr:MaoC/PaaZ C-terminal domain-containing protein [Streptomyces mutabilis]KFG74405.1 dehydratase [Streptomyces mutabilis]